MGYDTMSDVINYTVRLEVRCEWRGQGLEPDWNEVAEELVKGLQRFGRLTVPVTKGDAFSGSVVYVSGVAIDEAEV